MRETRRYYVASFEVGGKGHDPGTAGDGRYSKGRKSDSPLEPPEWTQPCNWLILAHQDWF